MSVTCISRQHYTGQDSALLLSTEKLCVREIIAIAQKQKLEIITTIGATTRLRRLNILARCALRIDTLRRRKEISSLTFIMDNVVSLRRSQWPRRASNVGVFDHSRINSRKIFTSFFVSLCVGMVRGLFGFGMNVWAAGFIRCCNRGKIVRLRSVGFHFLRCSSLFHQVRMFQS